MSHKKKYILSIDQGTTSSRTIVFDESTNTVAISQYEFNQLFPKSGWVEHDPLEILSSQIETIHKVLEKVDLDITGIRTIGITNQRETVIAWDRRTGKPIYNAIVWQDTRTSDYCSILKSQSTGQTITQKTGLIVDAYFSASKMKWIIDNVPIAKELIECGNLCFGTVDTWLIWHLTQGKKFVTDVSNASRTLLYNINTLEWDDELLQIFGIPKATLPEVLSSSDDFGIAVINNLSIPINGVAGDQQAALFGQCCFDTGDVKNTYGTGCFMLMNTASERVTSKNGLLSTIAWKIGDQVTYALEGSVLVAGAAIQWLRDGLKCIESVADTEQMVLNANPDSEIIFVPAFAGLGAPHWDMNARGALFGLTRDTSTADITKATLEAMAFQTKDVLLAMQEDAKTRIQCLKVDGGASDNDYLMQFQSDILSATLDRPICRESTALGAAFLAGIQAGIWNFEELKALRKSQQVFTPSEYNEILDRKYSKWLKAVEKSKNWTD